MKAQSNQVETVITLGIALLAAISVISLSSLISAQISSDVFSSQMKTAGYNLGSEIIQFESVNSHEAVHNLSLSQMNIESDFVIEGLGSQIQVSSPELEQDIIIEGFQNTQGIADSNNITIINQNNQITIE